MKEELIKQNDNVSVDSRKRVSSIYELAKLILYNTVFLSDTAFLVW